MPKIKLIVSIFIFSILLGVTSVIKTQTRIVEKKINKVENKIVYLKKNLHETQLDYFYLSSPSNLSNKINQLALTEYFPMDFSRIYLSFSDFTKYQKKMTIFKSNDEKKTKKE